MWTRSKSAFYILSTDILFISSFKILYFIGEENVKNDRKEKDNNKCEFD